MAEPSSIERAVRAVREANGAYAHEDGLWMTEGGLVSDDHFREIVRAVLMAIREPGEGVPLAAVDRIDNIHFSVWTAETAWQAMIDAMLAEDHASA